MARSPIACTATSRPPRLARATISRSSSALEQPHAASAVRERLEHRRRARAERAVGERLDRADPDPLVAEAAANAERERLVEAVGGQRRPHAEGEGPVGGDALPRGEPAAALEVVHAGQPAPVRLAHALAHGGVDLGLARRGRGLPAGERLVLAQQSGGPSRRRGRDDGVAIVRRDRDRPTARRRRRARRARAPARARRASSVRAPSPSPPRVSRSVAYTSSGLVARGEIGLLARERPLEEVDVRVVEAGSDAASREVDALGRDGRAIALPDVDAARNACASNGDCACPRQTWVACEHRTALEDHRRRVATIAGSDRR